MRSTHNVFAGAYIDRAAEFRTDPRWQAQALGQDQTRFVIVHGSHCVAEPEEQRLALLAKSELPLQPVTEQAAFLGLHDDAPVFALAAESRELVLPEGQEFTNLRSLGGWLPAAEANLAAHAVAMLNWRSEQRFCSRCGEQTALEAAGYASRCSNDACQNRTFPRVDPAIIVLVERGDECLLGRQASWPAKLYSTIAGFVEPGESLEDAVAREVFEETNIHVDSVHYHSSQPWPFPSALMLGFHARATSDDIRRNDGELEDVRWFTRDELRSREYPVPPRQSIARQLIDQWLGRD